MYLRGIDGDAYQNVLLDIKLVYVHDHLLVPKLLVLEVQSLLICIKSELLFDESLLDVTDACLSVYEERVQSTICG